MRHDVHAVLATPRDRDWVLIGIEVMRADEHGDIIMREKKRIESEIRIHMDDFVGKLQNPNKDNHKILMEGGPTTVLQAEASARKADLVCVGSHGKPWLVEAVLGSTAHELLSFPPCDVLVAPLS